MTYSKPSPPLKLHFTWTHETLGTILAPTKLRHTINNNFRASGAASTKSCDLPSLDLCPISSVARAGAASATWKMKIGPHPHININCATLLPHPGAPRLNSLIYFITRGLSCVVVYATTGGVFLFLFKGNRMAETHIKIRFRVFSRFFLSL